VSSHLPDGPPAIELKNVCKTFGTVQANKNINLAIARGSIHGIVGENGAGKSTLMNILYGLYEADSGEIRINGELAKIRSSSHAISLGIGMVHQHFMLVPNFTVLENVMLGSEEGWSLATSEQATLKTLKDLSEEYGMQVDPYAVVEHLPVGIRQRVEIIKALKGGADILILDEPTGVLTPQEADSLFAILKVLKARGVTVVLITHKLDEILAITDAVTIIRDGTVVANRKTADTSTGELAELMVGREVLLTVDRGQARPGEVRLFTEALGCDIGDGGMRLNGVSFELRAGEILGVAGVAGNGQTELLEILSGMRAPEEGSFTIVSHKVSRAEPMSPDAMRKIGVGHVPEDRHHHGLVLPFMAQENSVFGIHYSSLYGEGFFLNKPSIRAYCERLMKKFDVRPQNADLLVSKFSGGNQQKIVMAREIDQQPQVLLVGQPTRGVDIGAIEFIHRELIQLRDQGCAILLVSVELDEILGLSDRILVMNAGRQVGIVDRDQADERTLGLMMAGILGEEAA
jgi:general nucleoside transport system ATP-binding protein